LNSLKFYIIDLTKIEGIGDFKCPKCGIQISPDDKTEEVYTILKTVMKADTLEKIVLQCNSCKSQICLTGFQVLSETK
jgi:hypothetical protein